jgi:hypothetical protein
MIEETKTTREPTPTETAQGIAASLQEFEQDAYKQILHIVWALGRTQARALLQKTLDIEANGGMLVADGSRRRSVGGIFFHLAYTEGTPKPGKTLNRPVYKGTKTAKASSTTSSTQENTLTEKPFDRTAIIESLKQEKGTANVKIVVTGRPGKIQEYPGFVVTTMESTKMPAFPKGVPTPTNIRTTYSVYIGRKQWNKVSEAIKDPSDILVIEGTPSLDKDTGTIAVHATNVSTRNLQIAQKETQKAKMAEAPTTA